MSFLFGRGRRTQNHMVELIRDAAAQRGALRGLPWFLGQVFSLLIANGVLGNRRFHLLCALGSWVNGSAHCTFAHALAFDLRIFEKGQLFAMSEGRWLELLDRPFVEGIEELRRALDQSGVHDDRAWLERMIRLAIEDAEPADWRDRLCARLLAAMTALNVSCVQGRWPARDVPASRALVARYARARLDAQRP